MVDECFKKLSLTAFAPITLCILAPESWQDGSCGSTMSALTRPRSWLTVTFRPRGVIQFGCCCVRENQHLALVAVHRATWVVSSLVRNVDLSALYVIVCGILADTGWVWQWRLPEAHEPVGARGEPDARLPCSRMGTCREPRGLWT